MKTLQRVYSDVKPRFLVNDCRCIINKNKMCSSGGRGLSTKLPVDQLPIKTTARIIICLMFKSRPKVHIPITIYIHTPFVLSTVVIRHYIISAYPSYSRINNSGSTHVFNPFTSGPRLLHPRLRFPCRTVPSRHVVGYESKESRWRGDVNANRPLSASP